MVEKLAIALKCPRCGKKWIRANPKYQTLVCRNCGYTWTDSELMPPLEHFVL